MTTGMPIWLIGVVGGAIAIALVISLGFVA